MREGALHRGTGPAPSRPPDSLQRPDFRASPHRGEARRPLRATSLALASYQLPPHCLDRVHLLCPDPWPKKSHTARRLVCTDFLCRMVRVLKPGAIFHLSTDYDPYFQNWLQIFQNLQELYEPAPQGIQDMADVKTDFELHWNAQGKEVRHVCYRVRG